MIIPCIQIKLLIKKLNKTSPLEQRNCKKYEVKD